MDKKSLEKYRSKKDEITELEWKLRNRWRDEGLIGNDVIMDYRNGYPRPSNVIGFNYPRYDRLQEQDRARKAILLTECEEVEEWIEEIEDSLTRRIFRMTYIDGKKQKAVAKAVNLDRSRISRRIDDYLSSQTEKTE